MDLNYFKDWIFDTINDGKGINISDIEAHERENTFTIMIEDGSIFEIECKQKKKSAGKEI